MQKKNINKVLIGAVALIWGVVLYRFAAPYFGASDTAINTDLFVAPPISFIKKKDTFDLQLPQRDPFLGKSIKPRKVVSSPVSKPKSSTKKKTQPTVRKSWPRVEYLGFVKSSKNASRLGLVRVNGVLKRVRKGDLIRDIKVVKIEEEEITLSFQKDIKSFKK